MSDLEAFYPIPGNLLKSFRTGLERPAGDPFELGLTEPVWTGGPGDNTGMRTNPTTTVAVGDTVLTAADGLVRDVLFEGSVRWEGSGFAEMEDCEIEGKQTTTSNYIARNNQPTGTIEVEMRHCTLRNRWFPATDATDGGRGTLMGRRYRQVRCANVHATDGLGIIAPGLVEAEGCYFGRLWYFSPDAGHEDDGTHCDGAQGHGGLIADVDLNGCSINGLLDDSLPNSQANIDPVYDGSNNLIAGNPWKTEYPFWASRGYSFPPWGTSAVLFGYSTGSRLDRIKVRNGWLDGGSYAPINLAPGFTDANCTAIEVTGNRVRRNVRDLQASGKPWLIIKKTTLSAAITLTGNVDYLDGTPNNAARPG